MRRASASASAAVASLAPALLALGLALGGAGCFASWTAVQLTGGQRYLEEGAREVAVPQPDVREQLAISVPLAIDLAHPPGQAGAAATGTPATGTAATGAAAPGTPAASAPAPRPFAIGCESTQHASDQVHRAAFRYGRKWKYTTATMFVLEAAAAAASAAYYFADRKEPQPLLAAGALGLDALGTAALFFAPRKEIFRTELRPVTSRLRDDCPDGLALDIGGEVYPIDAAGQLGELGVAALDAWMQAPAPGAPLRVTLGGHAAEVQIGRAEQCAWNRSHHPEQPEQLSGCPPPGSLSPRVAAARLDVPMGTLAQVEAASASAP